MLSYITGSIEMVYHFWLVVSIDPGIFSKKIRNLFNIHTQVVYFFWKWSTQMWFDVFFSNIDVLYSKQMVIFSKKLWVIMTVVVSVSKRLSWEPAKAFHGMCMLRWFKLDSFSTSGFFLPYHRPLGGVYMGDDLHFFF